MKRLFRFTHKAAIHFVLSSLFALALLLSGLRLWLLPAVSDFQQPLETHIGALIGETVRIDHLSARLHGFHPELDIQGFHILDPSGRPAITFNTVRLDLDSFRSLAAGGPRFDRVEVVGPRLSLRRKPDGSWAVKGLTLMEKPPAWLLAGGRIDLRDAEVDWQDTRTDAPPLALGKVNLSLRNDTGRHRLNATFSLPGTLGKSLHLALDATGDLFTADGWGGTVYLEGQGLDAGRLAGAIPPPASGLRAGTVDTRIWGDWRGTLTRLAGEFQIQHPVFGRRPEHGADHRLSMKSVASRFFWERQADGWRLDLDRFRPALHGPWPDTRLALAVRRQADGSLSSVSAEASHLDLTDLRLALESLALLDEETAASLRAFAPRGTLGNPRFFHAAAAPKGQRWAFCGRFRNFGLNAQGSVPGLAGLHGEACGTEGSGRARVSTAPGQLVLTGLGVKKPIALVRSEAALSWQQDDTGWTLTVPSFSARNNSFSAEGHGRFVFPCSAESTPFLDLDARIGPLELRDLHQYLPTALIPVTADWIGQALKGGKASRWDLRFHGPPAGFPFYGNEGVFEADIDVKDLALRFHPAWLPLVGADARLSFRGPRMEVAIQRGRLGRGELLDLQGRIEDIGRNPSLSTTATVRAGVSETLDYLAQSPLRRIPERLRESLATSGNADIALKLEIPLGATPGEIGVDGSAVFHEAGLRVDALDLGVQNLEGPLRFGRGGLAADQLRARILGEPALIGIRQANGEVRVDIRGHAGIPALQRQFPATFWAYAQGATDYHLALEVPETLDTDGSPLRLALDSDLAGIALNLPAPLGKPATASRPLAVETRLAAAGDIPVTLAYGRDLQARFRFAGRESGPRLAGGAIAYGRPLPPADSPAGLSLHAQADSLDLAEWRRWWTARAGTGAIRPGQIDLKIGNLAWNGANLGPLTLNLNREADRWQGRIDSDYGRGEILAGPDSVRLDLDALKFPKKPDGAPSQPATPSVDGRPGDIDPATVPSLQVRARQVVWDNRNLGALELDSERRAHGMIVKTLAIAGKSHRLKLHGNWTRTPNRAPSTHLEGKARIDSLGDFLADQGHGGKVRDTPTDAEFTLDWPGAPYRLSAATVTGSVKLELGKGGLLEVEPGLGRVIGVLNLNSLWRRLSLDFSDLFDKGLGYDGVAGTFRIGGGQAVTEGFFVDAVSARIIANGRVGLVAMDLDQKVAVIPHTSAALPIAGALAGGPAVGAAFFVAQELIGEEVDSITATHYAVQGPWNDPTITRIHGNLPLDVLDRAWIGVKNLPVFDNPPEEPQK